ncbi:MAG: 6-carboxytetrahydropterin synthase [Candidatus Hydrogenedens sp.]|nr:6-carboxytetrahydropterin synthase [Candidatus Hydrogenedens sp.]
MLQISKCMYFDSAHKNEHKGGKYASLHGHTFFIEVIAHGEIDERYGWIVDFSEIKKYLAPIISTLDHSYLNEIPELKDNATLPYIKHWIIQQLTEKPWWFKDIQIGIVGDLSFAPHLCPPIHSLPELWCFSFESAQSLPKLPLEHPCHRLHGHSYFVKVHSDQMESLPKALKEIYDILDHRWLNEIEGLEQATSEILTLWIVEKLRYLGHKPDTVIVQETPSSFCLWKDEIK